MNTPLDRPWRRVAAAAIAGFSLVACDGTAPTSAPPTGKVAAVVTAPAGPRALDVAREIYKVPLGDSPIRGAATAKVTMVVFSEFQCPFCGRVEPTLAQLLERYGDDLRVVWKHAPLPFHERALPAAIAAEAARAQGRFWQMHDRLFSQQTALAAADLERHAGEVGLDLARFATALADPAQKARVEADLKLGETFAVRGTPTFFINGRRLVGAQPLDAFIAVIEEERARADEKLRAGVPPARLYAALTEGGLDKAIADKPTAADAKPAGCAGSCPGAAAAARADDPTRDDTVYKIDLGSSPVRGPAGAPITLVLFSDFECPFCKRVEPTIAALEAAYPGKIRVVWKNFPLPFHANAKAAARAALAAHAQGKFWAMHDRLLAGQAALDGASLERYARESGVDEAGWKASYAREDQAEAVEADSKLGAALGVSGTPTVFVNGRRIAGAYPLATFRAVVEQELAKKGG